MSNSYCTIASLANYCDERTSGMLSNDDGKRDPQVSRLNALLDASASELESHLATRATLPLATIPKVLEMWVARRAVVEFYGRRADKPKVADDWRKWCDDFITGWDSGAITLVGISRAVTDDSFGLTCREKTLNECPPSGMTSSL